MSKLDNLKSWLYIAYGLYAFYKLERRFGEQIAPFHRKLNFVRITVIVYQFLKVKMSYEVVEWGILKGLTTLAESKK